MNKRQETKLQEQALHMLESKKKAEAVWAAFEAEKDAVLQQMTIFDIDSLKIEDSSADFSITRVQGEKVDVVKEEAMKLPKKQLKRIVFKTCKFDEAAFKSAIKEHKDLSWFAKKFVTVNSEISGKNLIEMIELGEIDANKATKLVNITPKKQFLTVREKEKADRTNSVQ